MKNGCSTLQRSGVRSVPYTMLSWSLSKLLMVRTRLAIRMPYRQLCQRHCLFVLMTMLDTITLRIQSHVMTSITEKKRKSHSTLSFLTRLQKVGYLIRLSISHSLVLVSGKVYSCAIWLVPSSCKAETYSTLHLKWQRKKLLSELMPTSLTSRSNS